MAFCSRPATGQVDDDQKAFIFIDCVIWTEKKEAGTAAWWPTSGPAPKVAAAVAAGLRKQ